MILPSINLQKTLLLLAAITSLSIEPVTAIEKNKDANISNEQSNNALERKIHTCAHTTCNKITITKEMENEITMGYSEIQTKDINSDGTEEVILTAPTNNGANLCSKIFTYDEQQNTYINMHKTGGDICNFSIKENTLVSAYRNGAKWYNDIYLIEGKKLNLRFSDSCVGCGEIIRTEFSDNQTESFMVTDEADFYQRKKITSLIASHKAVLYKSPNLDNKTKSYLILNDKVDLLDSSFNNETAWYKVRYSSKNGRNIEAWLKCEDLKYCAE